MTPLEYRARREAYGVTQKELARIIGIRADQLSDWENGKTMPDEAAWEAALRIIDARRERSLGYRLRLAARKLGVSDEDIAEAARISTSTLRRIYLDGDAAFTSVLAVANFLNVRIQ